MGLLFTLKSREIHPRQGICDSICAPYYFLIIPAPSIRYQYLIVYIFRLKF